jgi:hypothetical protein
MNDVKLSSKYNQNFKEVLTVLNQAQNLTWYQSLGCDKLVEVQQQGTHRSKRA